jgi:hypothetical protein
MAVRQNIGPKNHKIIPSTESRTRFLCIHDRCPFSLVAAANQQSGMQMYTTGMRNMPTSASCVSLGTQAATSAAMNNVTVYT